MPGTIDNSHAALTKLLFDDVLAELSGIAYLFA